MEGVSHDQRPLPSRLEELLASIARLDRERERLATEATIENFKRHINRTVSAAALETLHVVEPVDRPTRSHVRREGFTRDELIAAWVRSDHTYAGLAIALDLPQGSLAFYLKRVCLTLAQLRSLECA